MDKPGVDAAQRLAVKAQALSLAGSETRHDDVRAKGESADGSTIPGVLEVEDDAAFRAVPHHGARHGACRVAAPRLDLDDARALVGEEHRRDGPCYAIGEVEHLNAGQNTTWLPFRSDCHLPPFKR